MSEAIQFERVEHAVLSTTHDYQNVFEFCKNTLISIGGKVKKADPQSGLLEASWKYGINPFGLRGSLIFRTLEDGAISITVKAGFKDSFATTGAPEKKAQEIIHALLQEQNDTDTTSTAASTPSTNPPAFNDKPVNASRNKTKLAMALISFFGGGLGLHKFYAGCWGWGLVYLGSCFLIPGLSALVALVEFIRILTLSADSFDEKYNQSEPKPFTFIW